MLPFLYHIAIFLHIGRHGCFKQHIFARDGVLKLCLCAVLKLVTYAVFVAAVKGVALKGHTEVRKMHPYLVRPPRFKTDF